MSRGVEQTLEAELAAARDEIAQLRAELVRHEETDAVRSGQLEPYAADLRETFKQERARSAELARSYRATVSALGGPILYNVSPGLPFVIGGIALILICPFAVGMIRGAPRRASDMAPPAEVSTSIVS